MERNEERTGPAIASPTVRENLTRDEARARAAVVSDVTTDVHLDLDRGGEGFGSTTRLRFTTSASAPLFVDLSASSVAHAALDGTPLDAGAIGPTRLDLGTVPAGSHDLEVVATMRYQHEGRGLHRFVDPTDDRVYLHSQFEPFDAHTVYACFDQPDLKTEFTLAVDAPAGWVVVSNAEVLEHPSDGAAGTWRFGPTPRISTYLTAVVAGHYTSVHDVYDRGDGSPVVPLGLYVRRSLAEHLEADELFEVTRQGLAFYERVFAQPYPFPGSYDQLFVPEFSAGAMENPGCITFSETYVFRSKVPETNRERRVETLLHEMAHIWFGDLVTMRWWDDLWLNESFATFMSVLAMVEGTRYTDAWVSFLDAEKAWAKHQDQLPSTHPVADEMPDVESVHQNFDGITYAKGASVLRQLVAWVGQDAFLAGCREYFARHAWGNTELADFLAALERTSGRDLTPWRDEWLRTTGVNVLQPELDVEAGHLTALRLHQSSPTPSWAGVAGLPVPPAVLRRHRLAVGLYDRDGEHLVRRRRVELDVTGETTVVDALAGEPAAALVLANDGDLTYAKPGLDAVSRATLITDLRRIADPLARALAWAIVWDEVRDGVLPARDYVPLVTANLTLDTPIGVVQRQLARVTAAVERYAAPEVRDELLTALLAQARAQLTAAPAGSDHQLVWARQWASCARVDAGELEGVAALLDGSAAPPEGLAVDTDLRWHLVTSLARAGAGDEELIAAELARDDTDLGQRQAATARAARPTAAAKAAAWSQLLDDTSLSHTMSRQLWGGFAPLEQTEVLAPYADAYFEVLDRVWSERSLDWATQFSMGMFPHHAASPALLATLDARLGQELPGPLRRVLLEQRDTLTRTLTARATDLAAGG